MALPNKIQVNAITGASLPSTLDNDINTGIKQPIIDILGIPDNTNISNAVTEVTATGLKNVRFQDAAADPATAGYLQRNATLLKFYDGAATRTLVSRDLAETLTNKTVNLSGNTLTGTTAQFNAALSDNDFATLAGSESLSNKTIPSPTLSGTVTGTYTLGGTLGISLFDTKGDLLAASANDTPAKLVAGSNGTVLISRSQATTGLAYVAALNMTIYGFTYSNSGGDIVNDIDIAAGGAMDITGAYFLVGAALTKQSDAAWAVGNNAGGLDTGAAGNNDYYIWVIGRSDTGVVDYLFSLSSTAPTMPTNYDFKRLIGWYKRVAGLIVLFNVYEIEGGGIEFQWSTPTLDVSLANTLTTSRRTDAVKVPLNFSVIAHLNVVITEANGSTNWIYCPDQTDQVPSLSAAPLSNISATNNSSNMSMQIKVRTSSAGSIAARSTLATVDFYGVSTMGFVWARRN